MTNLEEKKLIFVISQPRSGSTLLQRILGSHSQIHTLAEPWIMLPTVYALRDQGYLAEYNSEISSRAIELFIEELPNGQQDFLDGIRLMYQHIYGKALQLTSKNYFLDKTPRYYYIISELYSIFPNARFILLIRNPLDVLNSILNSWVKDNWYALYRFKDDLLKAPNLIQKAQFELGDSVCVMKYENLVTEPKNSIQIICDYIGISFEEEMINYNNNKAKKFELGDQQNIYKYKKPNLLNVEKWVNNLSNFHRWRLFKEYLEQIGEDTFNKLGYSYQECNQKIINSSPPKHKLYFSIPFSWLIKKPKDVKPFSYEWLFRNYYCRYCRFKELVSEKGHDKTFSHIIQKSPSLVAKLLTGKMQ